jgi:hypothetical protein
MANKAFPGSFVNTGPFRYQLKIIKEHNEASEIAFKGAIRIDGVIELLHPRLTPFAKEFVATRFIGIFQASEAGQKLHMELWSDCYGEPVVVAECTQNSPFVFEDRTVPRCFVGGS